MTLGCLSSSVRTAICTSICKGWLSAMHAGSASCRGRGEQPCQSTAWPGQRHGSADCARPRPCYVQSSTSGPARSAFGASLGALAFQRLKLLSTLSSTCCHINQLNLHDVSINRRSPVPWRKHQADLMHTGPTVRLQASDQYYLMSCRAMEGHCSWQTTLSCLLRYVVNLIALMLQPGWYGM